MSTELHDEIHAFILENYMFTDDKSSLGADESLLERGIVDSTGMMEIIAYLESDLGVTVDDDEMTPENLDSVNRLTAYVLRKRESAAA